MFGAWNSRDTQAKLPRLVASTIRAYDVIELTRSAQYNPPVDYIGLGLIESADDKKVLDAASELGFRHAPAAGTHGGVIVRGDIRREAILSLVGLRAIGPKGPSRRGLAPLHPRSGARRHDATTASTACAKAACS